MRLREEERERERKRKRGGGGGGGERAIRVAILNHVSVVNRIIYKKKLMQPHLHGEKAKRLICKKIKCIICFGFLDLAFANTIILDTVLSILNSF